MCSLSPIITGEGSKSTWRSTIGLDLHRGLYLSHYLAFIKSIDGGPGSLDFETMLDLCLTGSKLIIV